MRRSVKKSAAITGRNIETRTATGGGMTTEMTEGVRKGSTNMRWVAD